MKLKVFFEFVLSHNKYESLLNYGVREMSHLLISGMSSFDSIDIKDIGLWLDCGHCFKCTYKQNDFLIFIAKYIQDEPWELTIELERYPSFFSTLFGKKNKDFYLDDLKYVTNCLFSSLNQNLLIDSISISLSSNSKEVENPINLDW